MKLRPLIASPLHRRSGHRRGTTLVALGLLAATMALSAAPARAQDRHRPPGATATDETSSPAEETGPGDRPRGADAFRSLMSRAPGASIRQEIQEMAAERGARIVELSQLDAVALALRHNLDVRVSRFDQEVSEEAITAARAPFDPTLTFDAPASFNRQTSPQSTQLGGADVLTNERLAGGVSFRETFDWGASWSLDWTASRSVTNNTFSNFNPQLNTGLSINVSQPLLRDFGRDVNRAGIEVARNDLTVSRQQFRGQVEGVVFDTYQAYWELVFALQDLEVQRLNLDLARQQLERNEAQVAIGTLAPIETVQAEQAVANAEFQVVQAEILLENRQDELKELLNAESSLDAWNVWILPTDAPEGEAREVDEERAVEVALENDPQLLQARIDAESRETDLMAARNRLLPSLELTGSFALSGLGGDRIIRSGFLGGAATEIQEGGFSDALEQLMSGDFRNWSVGIRLSLPLHNWEAEARAAQASIRERQATTRIERRQLAVKVAVLRAARQLESGGEALEFARKARALAERQLDAEERKFAVGTTTNFQVLEFQRQLSEARTQELRSQVDVIEARASLELAKGTMLDSLGVSLDDAALGGGPKPEERP